jgi:hypothetical protein
MLQPALGGAIKAAVGLKSLLGAPAIALPA